jgi:hypothetical protein
MKKGIWLLCIRENNQIHQKGLKNMPGKYSVEFLYSIVV